MKLPSFLKRKVAPLTVALFLVSGCGGSNPNYVFTQSAGQAPAPIARDGKKGFSADAGVLGATPSVAPNTSGGPLLAIYMVGSDLESGGGAGTTDFQELITGLRTLSAEQDESLDILIAFGGANKDGWRGMKWMTKAQLLADSADGIYGNATQANSYLYRADGANMGHPSSLTQYLTFLNQHFPNKDRRFVVMWDHGGSYNGFGNDENFNNRGLTLPEIDQSFGASGLPRLDLLGFDACLMASMETVRYTREHSALLVASEELEPGHGWDYRYVAPAMANAVDMESFGRGLIDNFVVSANHPYEDTGKTLSLLNLDQAGPALDALQSYAVNYASYLADKSRLRVLSQSLGRSERYGQDGRSYTSVDLVGFITQSASLSGNALAAQELQAGLESLIVYSREDGSRPGSNGVSIAPPDKNASGLTADQVANGGWFTLVRAALGFVTRDTAAPVVVSRQPSGDGNVVSYSDETPTEGRAFFGSRQTNGSYVQIGELPQQETGVDDQFFIPGWDGRWLTLRDGQSRYTIPVLYAESDETGTTYYALAEFMDADTSYSEDEPADVAVLEIVVNEQNEVSCIVQPFFLQYQSEDDDDPEVIFERDAEPLAAGDRLQLYAATLREGGQESEDVTAFGGPIALRSAPSFEFSAAVDPSGGVLVSGAACEDFAENVVLTIIETL